MANRHLDWLKQAEADLRHAKNSLFSGDHDWACFAAQQAAEKGFRSLYYKAGKEAWGHTVSALMGSLPKDLPYSETLLDCSKLLDKHYILTRYPNGFDSGAPTDYYTKQEGEQAIACAEKIVKFCKDHLNTA